MNSKELIQSLEYDDALIEAKLGKLREDDPVLFWKIAIPTNIILGNLEEFKKRAIQVIERELA